MESKMCLTRFEYYLYHTFHQLMCFVKEDADKQEVEIQHAFNEVVQHKIDVNMQAQWAYMSAEQRMWWDDKRVYTQEQLAMIQQIAAALGISTQEAAQALQSVTAAYATHDDAVDALKYLASNSDDASYLKADYTDMQHRRQATVQRNMIEIERMIKQLEHIQYGMEMGIISQEDGTQRMQEIQDKIQK